jgi:NifB/MoaA-like Fe-S oxidoreductase
LSPEAPWVSLALSNAERIELSAGQVRQLEILRADFEEEAKSRLQTIGEAELDLRRTLSGAPVDLQQVSARLDRIADLRATYRLRRIETLLTGRDVLSIAQQEQLQDVVTQATTAMHRAMMDGIQEQEPADRSGGRM